MLVDLDAILARMDGWALSLRFAGNQLVIDPPQEATVRTLQTILSGDTIEQSQRPELEKLIVPLIHEPAFNVKNLQLGELVGIATAIVIHAQQTRDANTRGIIPAVVAAMKPVRSVTAPAEKPA